MRALIAIDSFKGSITSIDANQIVATAFARQGITSDQVAIADGGEGTVAAFLANHPGGTAVKVATVDPFQQPITAEFAYFVKEQLAVVEVAAASGIQYQQPGKTPADTNSYGTGLMIVAAIKKGAQKIIVGLGGSATVDGGSGILRAMGYRFFDDQHQLLTMTARDLTQVARVQPPKQKISVHLVCASDVTNPLYGEKGAAAIFGPQKGLSNDQVTVFDRGMKNWATILGDPEANHPGDGAAGGIGFALRQALGATVSSGFQLIAEDAQLKQQLRQANLVISGEGQVDDQSFMGKVPIQISQLAKQAGLPCYLLVGSQQGSLDKFAKQGVTSIFPIVDRPMSLSDALKQGPANLQRMAERLARVLSSKK